MLAISGRSTVFIFYGKKQSYRFTPENYRTTRGHLLTNVPQTLINHPSLVEANRCKNCSQRYYGNWWLSQNAPPCNNPLCESDKAEFWNEIKKQYQVSNHPTFCNYPLENTKVYRNTTRQRDSEDHSVLRTLLSTYNIVLYIRKHKWGRVTLTNPDPARWTIVQVRNWLKSKPEDHLWFAYHKIRFSRTATLEERAAAAVAYNYVKHWLKSSQAKRALRPSWTAFVEFLRKRLPNQKFVEWVCIPRVKYLSDQEGCLLRNFEFNVVNPRRVVFLKHSAFNGLILHDIWEYF